MHPSYMQTPLAQINYVPAHAGPNGRDLHLFPKRKQAIVIEAKYVIRDEAVPRKGSWTQLLSSPDYSGRQQETLWVRSDKLAAALGIEQSNQAIRRLRDDPHKWMRKHVFDKDMAALRAFYKKTRKSLKGACVKFSKNREAELPYSLIIAPRLKNAFVALGPRLSTGQRKVIDCVLPLWSGEPHSLARNIRDEDSPALLREQAAYASVADLDGINVCDSVRYEGKASRAGILQRCAPFSLEALLAAGSHQERRLNMAQRLELMRQVAQLVHRLHQRHCYLGNLSIHHLMVYDSEAGLKLKAIDLSMLTRMEQEHCSTLPRLRCCQVRVHNYALTLQLPSITLLADPEGQRSEREYATADRRSLAGVCLQLLFDQVAMSADAQLECVAKMPPTPLSGILSAMLRACSSKAPDAADLLKVLDNTEHKGDSA